MFKDTAVLLITVEIKKLGRESFKMPSMYFSQALAISNKVVMQISSGILKKNETCYYFAQKCEDSNESMFSVPPSQPKKQQGTHDNKADCLQGHTMANPEPKILHQTRVTWENWMCHVSNCFPFCFHCCGACMSSSLEALQSHSGSGCSLLRFGSFLSHKIKLKFWSLLEM